MIEYRPFLNTDTLLIVEIWRRQRPMRAAVDSFSRATLDSRVLAKPYFDRHGLIMAVDGNEPLGFVHAGFGPNQDFSDLDRSQGIISQLKVVDCDGQDEVASELLNQAREYLRGHGSTQMSYGSNYPHAPFYLGLYGGAQIGGVLDEDETVARALSEFGFAESQKILGYSRTLAGFRVTVNRQQMSVRREINIAAVADPIETSWWESCTFGLAERDCFHALQRISQTVVASVKYWDMQPLATKWGVAARGVHELEMLPEHTDFGLKLFLLGESIRHLMQQGIGLVEVDCPSEDASTIECLQVLGFEQTGQATSMKMEIS